MTEQDKPSGATPPTFSGFTPPTRNYYFMPNTWTDITSEMESLAELKIVEYVLRHTWGFHEFEAGKTISIDEFQFGRKYRQGERRGERMDKGTGLKSDRSVRDGIKLAIEHGYLICVIDDSDKARIKKSYALNMRDDGEVPARVVDTTTHNDLPARVVVSTSGSIYQSDPQILPVRPSNSTSRSKKDTRERNLEKETSSTTRSRANNNKKVFTGDEQSVWSALCLARELLIAERSKQYGYEAEHLESWDKPNKAQCAQVAHIVKILADYRLQMADFTPELISKSWQHAIDTKHFSDTVWQVGNIENELPIYLAFHYKPVTTTMAPEKHVEAPILKLVPSHPPTSIEDRSSVVLWTKKPHLMLGDLAQHWHILEWMPEGEARKYKYGEYEPYDEKEIQLYEQLKAESFAQ